MHPFGQRNTMPIQIVRPQYTLQGQGRDRGSLQVETGLLAEIRATERQAAEELGQWVTKSDPSHLNVHEMTERLNAGRERARKAALHEAALREGKGGQALNAGTQTSS